MANEIKIDGFTAIVPNEIYARETKHKKEAQKADAESWEQVTETEERSSTELLMLSIASLPSRQEVLERIAEDAKCIVADVVLGKLQMTGMDAYKKVNIDMGSDYSPAQQVLLCMPYRVVETLATALLVPQIARDYIEVAGMSYPIAGKGGKPIENDGDLDLIKIVHMSWETEALNSIDGDKDDAGFYWGLVNPKTKFRARALLMQEGKLDDKEIVAKGLVSEKMPEQSRSALLSAVDAVYSCDFDDMADKSPMEWHTFTYMTLKNMYNKLSNGILEKMKAFRERQVQAGKPETDSALERMAAEKNKQ